MEMLAIVVGLLVLLWITGLIKPLRVVSSSLESGAQIAERQMGFTNDSHFMDIAAKYDAMNTTYDPELVTRAKVVRDRIRAADF